MSVQAVAAKKRSRKEIEEANHFEVIKSGIYNWLRVVQKRRSASIRGDPESMSLDLQLRKQMQRKGVDLVLVVPDNEIEETDAKENRGNSKSFISICEASEDRTIQRFIDMRLSISDLHMASLLLE